MARKEKISEERRKLIQEFIKSNDMKKMNIQKIMRITEMDIHKRQYIQQKEI